MHNLYDVLGKNGILTQHFSGFQARDGQLAMAEHIQAVLNVGENAPHADKTLLIEAGTGTGKTLAYLLPLALTGKTAIISTASKTLQAQLCEKDLLFLAKILAKINIPMPKWAILKGRANYLCLKRLEDAAENLHQLNLINDESLGILENIAQWATTTKNGDLEAWAQDNAPLSPQINAQITSTTENCLAQSCPALQECFVFKARHAAQNADWVIANHHLLLASLHTRQQGLSDSLPRTEAIVWDEAHQIPPLASQLLGERLSARQLVEWAREIALLARETKKAAQELEQHVRQILRMLQTLQNTNRWTWNPKDASPILKTHFATLQNALNKVRLEVPSFSENEARTLTQLREYGGQLQDKLNFWLLGNSQNSQNNSQNINIINKNQNLFWAEHGQYNFILHQNPLNLAEKFQTLRQSQSNAWIFASATLTQAGSFAPFENYLGLTARQFQTESPFDYHKQARLYLPAQMPEPQMSDYEASVLQQMQLLTQSSRGGALILCTSQRVVKLAAQFLRENTNFEIFAQGEGARSALLTRFRDKPNSVLVGAASFWEGVDVVGAGLRLVIIDRLPFTPPNDPILSATVEYLRAQGGNPFMEYQLPHTITQLRQGVGRLIRSETDFGVMAILDSRLRSKFYGKTILKSLPPMPIVSRIEDVRGFFG